MTPSVWAEIDIAAIRDNLAAIRSFVGPSTDVMAVVKANAYGHGIGIVSRAAWEAGARWFGVGTVQEGAYVRGELTDSHICLFSPFLAGEESEIVRARLIPLLSSEEQAERLSAECRNQSADIEVHLEIDTGMGRSGMQPSVAVSQAERIVGLPGIRITGAATHFPCGDTDAEFSRDQARQLATLESDLRERGIRLDVIHAANSGGTLLAPEARLSLVRPGLLMYGIHPVAIGHERLPGVRPALSLKTRVALIRELPAGHTISYGRTHVLSRPSRVATLPVGYGDGYPRELSNRGGVLIRGKRAPILGRVCMDMTVVDVTEVPDAEVGDESVLIGYQEALRITAEEIAESIGTTEHDVTTRLTERVTRVPVGRT